MPATLPRPIVDYYATLDEFKIHRAHNEGATRHAFHNLLVEYARHRPQKLSVLGEQRVNGTRNTAIQVDALVVDQFGLKHGYWEAKDTDDDLYAEINKKIAKGYPLNNIIFENTQHAVLYQNNEVVFDRAITEPQSLQQLLNHFFSYSEPQIEEFHKAVAEFRQRIPELAGRLTEIINEAKETTPRFRDALADFLTLCRESLNPATTQEEVEDMLKQHILTERIFRSIFDNPDFVRRNVVAVELEKMVDALTSRSFSRDQFLKRLDFFYVAIERAAETISDYKEKQSLLNTLYEQFFQAYSRKAADTHGIVYTPHEIVAWMVNSVEEALKREFGLSLASEGVHIIDPCVGTGTFIMELLQHIPASALPHKYAHELHANEVLLLPYYIAAQNIEHAYFERTGHYAPFEGLCFADTLNMEKLQHAMFAPANTERIVQQNQAPIRVVIGNPPYNVGQISENDNNKNRRYPLVDARIRETYAAASRATNKNALSDMYVKFFRWATDRLGDRDGLVCFVSNNGFLGGIAFDGFREHLFRDFTRIYHFDFKGNARTSGERRRQEAGNIFNDQIRTGVGITLLIRNSKHTDKNLSYHTVGNYWDAEAKRDYLASFRSFADIEWQMLKPDVRNTWLIEGLQPEFDEFMPMGTKEAKALKGIGANSIFALYSAGVKTNRDEWAYDFDQHNLSTEAKLFIETYNAEVDRWKRSGSSYDSIDDFVRYDDRAIKWSETLKSRLQSERHIRFDPDRIRKALYRPFCKQCLYFDRMLVERVYVFPSILPARDTELENAVICVSAIGASKQFHALLTNVLPDIHLTGDTQCFPFYTYDEDGTNRRENITDWALAQFRTHYTDPTITKWDIFHYVYGVLHSPDYRAKYAENLKRDLPRIPFVPAEAFRRYVEAGAASPPDTGIMSRSSRGLWSG